MMDNAITRQQALRRGSPGAIGELLKDVHSARAEVERLSKQVARYRGALGIFANKDNWQAIGHELAKFSSLSMTPWDIAAKALEDSDK